MAEGVIFHYREADNILTRLNPCTKLLSVLVYSVVVSSSSDSTAVFVLFLFPLIIASAIRLPVRSYLKESIFFLILALFIFISSFLSFADPVAALVPSVRFLSVMLISMLLTDTTMPDDIARSLGAALSHILGRAAYLIASVVEITISMIPLIIDCVLSIYEARRARGASFVRHPLRSASEFSASLITDLLDKAEIYADALSARGYSASGGRYTLPYGMADRIIIAISIIVLISHILISIIGTD